MHLISWLSGERNREEIALCRATFPGDPDHNEGMSDEGDDRRGLEGTSLSV